MPSITEIHTIAPIAQVLAANDVADAAMFGGSINPKIAIQIYLIRIAVDYRYDLEDIAGGNTPSDSLVLTSNYLWAWMREYGTKALALFNSGGVIPNPYSPTLFSIPYSSSYTALADGETVLLLRDINGTALPTGSLITWVQKSALPLPLSGTQYSYSAPYLTLLNGIEMSAEEILSFQYVVPI